MKILLQRGDRFLLLLNLTLLAFFYLGQAVPLLPLSLVLPDWDAAAYLSPFPRLLFACLCLFTSLISFWWADRSPFSGDRRLLQLLFTLALTTSFLQLFTSQPLFTLLTLLAFIMGMAIAVLTSIAV